jgi:hypothetical protein
MNIETVSDFRKAIRNGPYAWPGGYPLFFITNDGAAISFEAAKAEKRQIIESIGKRYNDGWRVIACEVNWEDPSLLCEHTGKPIECAYAD